MARGCSTIMLLDWRNSRQEEAWSAVPMALDAGMRHFDGALVYCTGRHLGDTLGRRFAEGSVRRSELFLTTKIFHPPVPGFLVKSRTVDMLADGLKDQLLEQFDRALEEMGVGYVDLLLAHWPGKFGSTDKEKNRQARRVCWEVFEELYEQGKAKSVGVSNWTEDHLASLIADGVKVVPQVNQIEMSPYTIWEDLVKFCQDKNIVIQAYSPLGSTAGGCLKDPLIVELAQKYKKNPGQLVLRWLVQQNIVVLPRSSSASRIASNMDVFDFEIDKEDMAKIWSLNKKKSFTNANPYDIP